MNRRRTDYRGLTDSRIYPKRKRFYLFSAEPLVNPKTGKASKWHSLCNITEGEDKARELAKAIRQHNSQADDEGDMPRRLRDWLGTVLAKREKEAPHDAARRKMFDSRNKDLQIITELCIRGFRHFDVPQVIAKDIADFVDQWEGQRMAQVCHSHLAKFFQWCCRKGFRTDNPVREVDVEAPKKRARYITDEEFNAVRAALLIGEDDKPTQTGEMIRAYVDLCYLCYQRTTELRLLRWNQIKPDGIHFTPTKTEASTGKSVIVPMTDEIRDALDRAKAAGRQFSMYVIHTKQGQPYTPNGLGTAWKRARVRAGVTDATLKDIRAKAISDAKKKGYTTKQIQLGAVHTTEGMTEHYIRDQATPVSEVMMQLPPEKKTG